MNKEEIKATLVKNFTELTKEEISDIFKIFCFTIKEFHRTDYDIRFEIHFKRTYLIEVCSPLEKGAISFRNQFINFGEDGIHGIAMRKADNIGDLLKIFINMFHATLLADVNYSVYYDEDNSDYSSYTDFKEIFEYTQKLL